MLKCPKCKGQTAWVTYGIKRDGDTHRHFKQKECGCGFIGKPIYRYPQTDGECIQCKLRYALQDKANE